MHYQSNKSIVVYVAVNENGHRIGETHPNSKISDQMVDRIRELHEDFGHSYRRIAKELNLCRELVAKICRYERRAQTIDRWKKILVREEV